MKKLKITERGFAGHFCASSSCYFRRNTLVEYGNKRVVVSTVGNYHPPHSLGEDKEIGCGRFYETMAFEAKYVAPYWEADVSKEFHFKSNWILNELNFETDLKADQMHDKVVKEISKSIIK
jgi:hypothetical protein